MWPTQTSCTMGTEGVKWQGRDTDHLLLCYHSMLLTCTCNYMDNFTFFNINSDVILLSVLSTDRSRRYFTIHSVSQSVCIGVEPTLWLVTRYYFLSEDCCLKVAVLFLWDALSDERTDLQFPMQSLSGPSRIESMTILYLLIWDSPNLEGQVPVFISPRNRLAQLYPRVLGSIYVASNDSQGYGGGILTVPQPGGPGLRIYIPQEQDGPVQSESQKSWRKLQTRYVVQKH
jgi:hypothetical protein